MPSMYRLEQGAFSPASLALHEKGITCPLIGISGN